MSRLTQKRNRLGKPQWLSITVAGLLCCILYFGFSLKKPEFKDVELKRAQNSTVTSEENIIREGKSTISKEQFDVIIMLEKQVRESDGGISELRVLSAKWFDIGYPIISAIYAEKLAEKDGSDTAWSIAGTTYFVALKNTNIEENRIFASKKAATAFENAISENPNNINHRVNLALTYTEQSAPEDPMKGVKMLLDLNQKYPENVVVLKSLGRLGMQTGQFEKAKERLEKAISIQPDDTSIWCLLVSVYEKLNLPQELQKAQTACNK